VDLLGGENPACIGLIRLLSWRMTLSLAFEKQHKNFNESLEL
jgi:hypothetical protein